MHKIYGAVSILHQRTLPAPKTLWAVSFYQGFLQSGADHSLLQFCHFLLFLPPQHAAKQPNIAVNPSFSIHTATHSVQLKQTRLFCVCCIKIPQHSCKLSDWRGGAAVVNCESKTVNRIWSRKRSGAWCMDGAGQQKHINWINCFYSYCLLLLDI